jgi:hypothetical protein
MASRLLFGNEHSPAAFFDAYFWLVGALTH